MATTPHDTALGRGDPPREAQSAIGPALLLLCATLPGYVVLAALKPETAGQIWRVVACLALMAAFAIMVGAAASSVFRTTAVATAVAYATLAAVCIVPLLVWLGRGEPFGYIAVGAALTVSPVAAALSAADAAGFSQFDLLPANWWAMGGACLALLAVLVIRTRNLMRPE